VNWIPDATTLSGGEEELEQSRDSVPAFSSFRRIASTIGKEEAMRSLVLALCGLLALLAAAPADAAYQVGDPIANFTLFDADGVPVSLFDYQGKVVWLVFWSDT
jgi:hypothetical protein